MAGKLHASSLGTSFIDVYEELGLQSLYKPTLRADMEDKMSKIALGENDPKQVLAEYLNEMQKQYVELESKTE